MILCCGEVCSSEQKKQCSRLKTARKKCEYEEKNETPQEDICHLEVEVIPGSLHVWIEAHRLKWWHRFRPTGKEITRFVLTIVSLNTPLKFVQPLFMSTEVIALSAKAVKFVAFRQVMYVQSGPRFTAHNLALQP